MSNRYFRHSRLSDEQFRRIVRFFSLDMTAEETALETNFDRMTINNIFTKIRHRLAGAQRKKPYHNTCRYELRNEYYCAHTEEEVRRLSQKFTYALLVILYQENKVQADIIYYASTRVYGEILKKIEQIKDESIKSYGFFEIRLGVRKRPNQIVRTLRQQIAADDAEAFITYATARLKKFKGIKAEKFVLHLRETEMRYNAFSSKETFLEALHNGLCGLNGNSDNFFEELLEILSNNPL